MIPRFPMTPETAKAIMEDNERRRKAREEKKRAKALARELEAALRDEQGPAQPRAHWRYPTVLARMRSRCVCAGCCRCAGVLAHALSGSACTDWPEPATLGPVFVRV